MARNFELKVPGVEEPITLGTPCQFCHGSGKKEIVKLISANKKATALTEDDFRTVECGECDAKGMHITDAGEELLRFLKASGFKL